MGKKVGNQVGYWLDIGTIVNMGLLTWFLGSQLFLFVNHLAFLARAAEIRQFYGNQDGVYSPDPNAIPYVPADATAEDTFVSLVNETRLLVTSMTIELIQFLFFVIRAVYTTTSRRVFVLIRTTMNNACNVICSSFLLLAVGCAFALLGFVTYGDEIESFSSVMDAALVQFGVFFGHLPYTDMRGVDSFGTPIYATLAIIVEKFIILNLFLATLMYSFDVVFSSNEESERYALAKVPSKPCSQAEIIANYTFCCRALWCRDLCGNVMDITGNESKMSLVEAEEM